VGDPGATCRSLRAAADDRQRDRARGSFEDVATIELTLGDLTVRAITIDEVIASKEMLARPKDTAALPALYATREAIRRRKR
jgi:hypothetical protein